MKILGKALFCVLGLCALPCNSQNRVGNGGNVILCEEKSQVTRIELLDFFETHLPLVELSGNHLQIAEKRFEVLGLIDSALGKQYLSRLAEMKKEMSLREGVELVPIADSNHILKPAGAGCSVQQIAIRKREVAQLEPRFVINKKYWDLLSPRDQAGLLVHEIVYEHFYKLGEKSSDKARIFTAHLFGKKFEGLSKAEHWKFVTSLKVPLYQK